MPQNNPLDFLKKHCPNQKPSVNECNRYLFDRIDDIVDRVPNSRIEQHYGSLTPDDIATPAPFWQTIMGDDYRRDIEVIAVHNNSDSTTTIKTLNFFGSLFLETQETAQKIIDSGDAETKADLRTELSNQNRFISWTASQLCMDIAVISGDTKIDPKFRLNIFEDCARTASPADQRTLKDDYTQRFEEYSAQYPTGAFDQYKNDLRDVVKDLGIYLGLYPDHVTTNMVLTHYQNHNPGKELISLDLQQTDVKAMAHPLHASFMTICTQTGIDPASFEIATFDKAKELPPFTSLDDSPKWQKIKNDTPTQTSILEILDNRRQQPAQIQNLRYKH